MTWGTMHDRSCSGFSTLAPGKQPGRICANFSHVGKKLRIQSGIDTPCPAGWRSMLKCQCHVAVWTENSAGMGRCCPLEREIRAGNFSIMRQKARMSCGRTFLPRGFPDVPLVSSLPNVAATCVAEFSIQRQRHAEISHSKRQFLNLAVTTTH